MVLTLLAENLQKKLSLATHAISTRSQLPILSHVLLETRGDKLCISATDLEIGIEVLVPAQIEEEGGTTIPAKLFLELAQTLPQDKITLKTTSAGLEIIGKHTRSILQTTPKDEFPTLYEDLGEQLVSLKAGEVKKIFSKVVFSSSIEATRPALSGMYFKKSVEGFTVVSTDGYRLSLEQFRSENGQEGETSVIIPAKVIKEAMGMREDEDVALYISRHNNQVVFSQSDIVLVGRLIEAEFPNYQKIIPTDSATKVAFDREELHKAVKACSVFAREAANIIKFSIKKETIIISAKTPSLGENTVEVEGVLTGEENDIAFNARYVLDFLANVGEEQLTFEMSGPLNPGVFRIVGNPHFLHLIMPIRTQE